jgi:hypothetical protein
MMDGTKGGAQRASSLRPRCVGEVDPEIATHIYLSIYLSIYLTGDFKKLHNEKHHELSDQMNENDMVRAYSMCMGDKKSIQDFREQT